MMENPIYKWMMVPGVPPWIGNLQLGLVNLNFEKPCPWEGSTHYNHLTIRKGVSYWITSTQFHRLGGISISTVYSKRDIIGLPCEPRAFMTYVDVMSENPLVYCVNPLGPQAISVTNWIFQEQLPPLMLDHVRFVRSYINWAQHPRPSMISENIEIHRSLVFFIFTFPTPQKVWWCLTFLQKKTFLFKNQYPNWLAASCRVLLSVLAILSVDLLDGEANPQSRSMETKRHGVKGYMHPIMNHVSRWVYS